MVSPRVPSALSDMHLVVVSHKLCWRDPDSASGYATDGGFPLQMRYLSQLFHRTTLLVPCEPSSRSSGLTALSGPNLRVVSLPVPRGRGFRRKLGMFPWLACAVGRLLATLRTAHAVHTPLPGDVGTIGLGLALLLGKPTFVRHCGNWDRRRTVAERVLPRFLGRIAGGRNVVWATGTRDGPPSPGHPAIRWTFSTSLSAEVMSRMAAFRHVPDLQAPRLITVGRQEAGKGTLAVLEALVHIRRSAPRATLDIVGDGKALEGLRETATRLGLEACVRFHGRLPHEEVLDRLREADLFCMPSASEGFPKAVVEALAAGLPVVASDLPVMRHLVGSTAGAIVTDDRPESIAQAITSCLQDRGHFEGLSKAARSVAHDLTLERWRDEIAAGLTAAWIPRGEAA